MHAQPIELWHALVGAAVASRELVQFGLVSSLSVAQQLARFAGLGVAQDMRRWIDACLDERRARADLRMADVLFRQAEVRKTLAEAAVIERTSPARY